MSLRRQAALDARTILQDTSGFGETIRLLDPDGVESTQTGFATDIGQVLDPETGELVAGTRNSILLSMAALLERHSKLPEGATSPSAKPWIITVADIVGVQRQFMIAQAMPDRTLGVVRCDLEIYRSR